MKAGVCGVVDALLHTQIVNLRSVSYLESHPDYFASLLFSHFILFFLLRARQFRSQCAQWNLIDNGSKSIRVCFVGGWFGQAQTISAGIRCLSRISVYLQLDLPECEISI